MSVYDCDGITCFNSDNGKNVAEHLSHLVLRKVPSLLPFLKEKKNMEKFILLERICVTSSVYSTVYF